MWDKIAELTNQHGYMSGNDRMTDRVKATGEVFTPTDTVIDMMKSMLENDPDVFAPGKTVLDPACGDGQLLVPVKWYKVLVHGMSEADACNDLFGIDIMQDNVLLCKQRLGGGNIFCDNALDPQSREVQELLGVAQPTLEDFFI